MASTSTELDHLDPATAHKIATAKQLKDTADQAFKAGKTKDGEYLTLFCVQLEGLTRR